MKYSEILESRLNELQAEHNRIVEEIRADQNQKETNLTHTKPKGGG